MLNSCRSDVSGNITSQPSSTERILGNFTLTFNLSFRELIREGKKIRKLSDRNKDNPSPPKKKNNKKIKKKIKRKKEKETTGS